MISIKKKFNDVTKLKYEEFVKAHDNLSQLKNLMNMEKMLHLYHFGKLLTYTFQKQMLFDL